jgi:hypothetical protein
MCDVHETVLVCVKQVFKSNFSVTIHNPDERVDLIYSLAQIIRIQHGN